MGWFYAAAIAALILISGSRGEDTPVCNNPVKEVSK